LLFDLNQGKIHPSVKLIRKYFACPPAWMSLGALSTPSRDERLNLAITSASPTRALFGIG
jgi:hypothetical protein